MNKIWKIKLSFYSSTEDLKYQRKVVGTRFSRKEKVLQFFHIKTINLFAYCEWQKFLWLQEKTG